MSEAKSTAAEVERRANIIAIDYAGISPVHEAFYIHSIIYPAERALQAFGRYDDALLDRSNFDLIVSSVHEALGHAAALSRFFWPSRMGQAKKSGLYQLKEARGRKLREAFDLAEESALRSRQLRDALEHFDEKMDEFLLVNDAGVFYPTCLVSDPSFPEAPFTKYFKFVDPENSCFILLNERFYFGKLRQEVADILKLAKQMDVNGNRL